MFLHTLGFLFIAFLPLNPSLCEELHPVTSDAMLSYGAYMDGYYADDFGGSNDEVWRSKGTTERLNMPTANIAMAYVSKSTSDDSPWGGELGFMGGSNPNDQRPNTSPIAGMNVLHYLSRANVSFQVKEVEGLKLSAGLINSFIGYESFYAGLNSNYTRAYIADYTPYFLIGAGGQYTVNTDLSFSLFLVTDYNYLQWINNVPKYASQICYRFTPQWTFTENVFFGAEQQNTALQYWRGLSDSIIEWEQEDLLFALAYDIGTEQRSTSQLRSVWMGSAFWARWKIKGPWAMSVRPEVYWDPNGELTGYQQSISAITLTGEYKVPVGPAFMALRTEFRHDTSTGPQGGFYNPASNQQQLVPGQNLFFISMIWSYDKN